MKYITFPGSGLLTGLATMLSSLGHETDAKQIAFGMEMPWLFLNKDGRYYAGPQLFQPEWVNLYLNSLGFQLNMQHLSPRTCPPFCAHTLQ